MKAGRTRRLTSEQAADTCRILALSASLPWRKPERDQLDEAVVPEVPRQRRPAAASRPGLQSRQFHAHAGSAEGGRALVIDDAAGEIGEDRSESGQPRAVRHFPTGRGCRPKKLVPKNPEPD